VKEGEHFLKTLFMLTVFWFQSPVLLQMVIGLYFHFWI